MFCVRILFLLRQIIVEKISLFQIEAGEPMKVQYILKKFTGTLDLAMKTGDPMLFQIAAMLTPHDYSIFPLTRNLAVLNVSTFFKLCMPGSLYNVKFTEEAPTISKVLGFGSITTIKPPIPKAAYERETEYTCEIQQLSRQDTVFLNSLLLGNVDKYFAYADCSKVKRSIDSDVKYKFAIVKR